VTGRVVLVGAGPGDPDLLTLRALRELERAEVLLYDALIEPAVLELANPACERIDVGKRGDGSKGVAQDKIADLLIEKARQGRYVVRLKGGDPFVFGRGGEEASRLRAAGIPFEIVPGVTSALAVPAYAGIPVTDRRLSSSVAIVTGHRGKDEFDRRIDWEGLAASAETLVVLMGTAWLDDICARVIAGGRDPATPAAAISRGTTPQQRVVTARLDELAQRVTALGLGAPTVIVIGRAVEFRQEIAWYELLPLFGKRVLVPRAASQSAELVLELRRRGAEPVTVPLLAFAPSERLDALRAALARVPESDWLVFTSANAVRFSAPHLPGPGRARVACIGAATAREAEARGLRVAIVSDEGSPEALAAEIAAVCDLAGAAVVFPRAARARETLADELVRRGARVDSPEAYRTIVPDGAAAALREALARGIDAVALTSPSTVEHLFAALDPRERDLLAGHARFACIGPTTAEALRAARPGLRFETAARPSMSALCDATERACAEEQHGLS
jgi:uroporphyrinogen III methyltransferase / synthase